MAVIKETRRRVQFGFDNGVDDNGKTKVKRNSLNNVNETATADDLLTLGDKYGVLIDKKHLQTKKIVEEIIVPDPLP